MAKSTYKFEGSELEKWMSEFLSNNGNVESNPAKVKEFIDELYQKIM